MEKTVLVIAAFTLLASNAFAEERAFGEMADQDGNEDDIIDPEDNLKRGQGDKGHPDFRGSKPFHYIFP